MKVRWLKKRLGRKPSGVELPEIPLRTAAQFQRLLELERSRAERTGVQLALVVFDHPGKATPDQVLSFCQDRILPRLRTTDHAMLTERNEVCVLLWNTSLLGAESYIQAVQPPIDPWLHVIYLYPRDEEVPPPRSKEEGSNPADHQRIHRTLDELEQRLEEILDSRPQEGSRKTVSGETSQPEESHAQPQSMQSAECRSLVRPMESLMIKPLPLWKRAIDIVGASVGLLLLSPLLLMTSALIKLTSRGPILFCQKRAGLGGKPFTIYKFRTMMVDAEAKKAELCKFSEQDGPAFKMKNDPRITKIGKYLRKTAIDELPQLINVVKGDMTLVGPRPLPVNESEQTTGWERRRLDVTPGLTCIWQIHGKSKVSFREWMRMDIRYIKARTFFQDLKLICQTVLAVILHRASQ